MIYDTIFYVNDELDVSKSYKKIVRIFKGQRTFCLFFICFVDILHQDWES